MFYWVFRKGLLGLLALAVVLPSSAFADDRSTIDTARFTLHFGEARQGALINPREVALNSLAALDRAFADVSKLFHFKADDKVVIRFLSPDEFHRRTGAPEWTSAMYLRGEISIPLPENKPVNLGYLERAVRHEYVHAVTAELSGRSCPAWLDEGLAQIIEGDPNPLLGPALRRWLAHNEAMPLDWLRGGFTSMSSELVPAAYAHSLFATRHLLASTGYDEIRAYLLLLHAQTPEKKAFHQAFGRHRKAFEADLRLALNEWRESGQFDP